VIALDEFIDYEMIDDGFECSLGYSNCPHDGKQNCSECDFYTESENDD
jgi:hypothetical protein